MFVRVGSLVASRSLVRSFVPSLARSSLLGRCALPVKAVGGEATCELGAPVTSAGIGLRFVGGEGGHGVGCALDSFALW